MILASAVTVLLLLASSVDSSVSRQIAAPCQVVEQKAVQYLADHNIDVHTDSPLRSDEVYIHHLGGASTPLGKPLSLNRSSIRKYTLHRHLSPMKVYDDFRLEGQLRFANTTEASCNATLHFEISAFEYVWALAAIDDGYRSKFISNGALERLYMDAMGDLFAKP